MQPKFSLPDAKDLGYWHNCQTCTVAYELRRRGFNVEASPNKDNEFYNKWCIQNKFNWVDRFLKENGKRANYIRSTTIKDSGVAKLKFIEDQTAVQGRYEIYCARKGREDGHVFIVERQKNGELLWFDPQTGRRGGAFKDYLQRMARLKISVLRIDDKLINPLFAERLIKAI